MSADYYTQDPLILSVGPRRLSVNPVYSQHTRGGGKGANNVHKFERYLRHGVTNVATVYGPIIYGTQPCLLLRGTSDLQGQSTRHHIFHRFGRGFWLDAGLYFCYTVAGQHTRGCRNLY